MVLKTINKQKTTLSPAILEQEFKNLVILDHPHIIRLFDYYDDYTNIYVVMDFAEGGELLNVIEKSFRAGKTIPEWWVMTVFRQVLDALAYCHSRGVMHKDIKAENITLTKRDPVHAVVIDFGLAEAFTTAGARSRVVSGTPYTMAPEVWQVMLRKGSIGYKCD
jgi:serine/threonine protein kinase